MGGGSKEEENCEAAASIEKRKRDLKEEVDRIEKHNTDLPKYYSLLACALALLGEAVVKCQDQEEVKTLVPALTGGFAATFDIKHQRDTNYWNHAFCDTLVILIAFWSGYWLQGGFFLTPFSSYMSSSLAVMLSEPSPGGSLNTNVQRLLGVSIGKSLTLVIMAIVSLFGDSGLMSDGTHIAMVYLFMTFFSYVYYDGGYWSYVACLVTGFGCYTLAGTNAHQAFSSITLTTRYAEICQLTSAIVGRLVIDALYEQLFGFDCRKTILRYTKKLTWKFQQDGHGDAISTQGINNFVSEKLNMTLKFDNVVSERFAGKPRKWGDKGTPGVLIKAMNHLWEGTDEYKKFQECVDKVAKQIKHVEVAVTNVRGAAVLARGHQASLDVDLLTVCLTHMTDMLRGLRTLQAIHTSILIDGIQIDKNEKERNEKDEKDIKDKSPKGSTCREAVARESIEDILKLSHSVQNFVRSSGILRYDRLSP